VTRISKEFK